MGIHSLQHFWSHMRIGPNLLPILDSPASQYLSKPKIDDPDLYILRIRLTIILIEEDHII